MVSPRPLPLLGRVDLFKILGHANWSTGLQPFDLGIKMNIFATSVAFFFLYEKNPGITVTLIF